MFPRGILPYKLRRKWRATKARMSSRVSPASSITHLETSFSPKDTIYALRKHKWSMYDGQYLILVVLAIFCLSIMAFPSPLFRTFVATLVMGVLLVPVTRQFWLPFLPIAGWLVLFWSCK
jgi:hypothetical protein